MKGVARPTRTRLNTPLMSFNITKCSIMCFNQKPFAPVADYTLHNDEVKLETTHKYNDTIIACINDYYIILLVALDPELSLYTHYLLETYNSFYSFCRNE